MWVWVVGGCKNSLRNAAGEKNVRQNLLDLADVQSFWVCPRVCDKRCDSQTVWRGEIAGEIQ